MSTKSREYLFGMTIRVSEERAKEARKEADRLACEAWNFRMLGYKGPAQPSPALGDKRSRSRSSSADSARNDVGCGHDRLTAR
jgi:hypothetical protein